MKKATKIFLLFFAWLAVLLIVSLSEIQGALLTLASLPIQTIIGLVLFFLFTVTIMTFAVKVAVKSAGIELNFKEAAKYFFKSSFIDNLTLEVLPFGEVYLSRELSKNFNKKFSETVKVAFLLVACSYAGFGSLIVLAFLGLDLIGFVGWLSSIVVLSGLLYLLSKNLKVWEKLGAKTLKTVLFKEILILTVLHSIIFLVNALMFSFVTSADAGRYVASFFVASFIPFPSAFEITNTVFQLETYAQVFILTSVFRLFSFWLINFIGVGYFYRESK